MDHNGRSPGLLEQYAHLIHGKRGGFGRRGAGGTSGTANRTAQGTIKRLMPDRGFGFIQAEGEREDLFFHRSSLGEIAFENLKEGDFVEFEVQHDLRRDRNQAVNIRRCEKPEPGKVSHYQARPSAGRLYDGWQNGAARGGGRLSPFRQQPPSGRGLSEEPRSRRPY